MLWVFGLLLACLLGENGRKWSSRNPKRGGSRRKTGFGEKGPGGGPGQENPRKSRMPPNRPVFSCFYLNVLRVWSSPARSLSCFGVRGKADHRTGGEEGRGNKAQTRRGQGRPTRTGGQTNPKTRASPARGPATKPAESQAPSCIMLSVGGGRGKEGGGPIPPISPFPRMLP